MSILFIFDDGDNMSRQRLDEKDKKEKISLYINSQLIKALKDKNINISQLVNKMLESYIKR